MKSSEAAGWIAIALLYGGLIGGLWLYNRRKKQLALREKMTGRLPVRRVPAPRGSANPAWFVILGMLWAFLPAVAWLLASLVFHVLTPPQARIYGPPIPAFREIVAINLKWWLWWAGGVLVLLLLARLASWLTSWLTRCFTDPSVSLASLARAGDREGAIRVLREAIEARGPSVGRLEDLADCLMKQGQWLEAFKVSLDIEDRAPLYTGNRRRKALALCRLGYPEEAIAITLRPNGDRARQLPDICAYCQLLTDLGLYDRAWDQLRRAELIFSRRVLPEPEASSLRQSIDACRARLAEHFPGKKSAGSEEL